MTLINCDLGECLNPDPDELVMPLIDMASIACGGHVGDEASITKTLRLAKEQGVTVGAHPGYFDQKNFGRISHNLNRSELMDCLKQQLDTFINLCEQQQVSLSYIKPHGALYHDMINRPDVLDVICDLIREIDPKINLVVQAGIRQDQLQKKSQETNIEFLYEAFADRGYHGAEMIPRSKAGAMLMEPVEIIDQFDSFSSKQHFPVDTICFHSDHPPSVIALQLLKDRK